MQNAHERNARICCVCVLACVYPPTALGSRRVSGITKRFTHTPNSSAQQLRTGGNRQSEITGISVSHWHALASRRLPPTDRPLRTRFDRELARRNACRQAHETHCTRLHVVRYFVTGRYYMYTQAYVKVTPASYLCVYFAM